MLTNGMPIVGDTVWLTGQDIDGGVVSKTLIEKEQVLILSALSTAVHLTMVVPSGNVDPVVLVQVTDLMPDASVAVAILKVTGALGMLFLDCRVILEGQTIAGLTKSVMLTIKLHDDVRFALLVALQDTVVAPRGKTEPEFRVHPYDRRPEPADALIWKTGLKVGVPSLGD
jgi:hypothetical protein